MDRNFNDLSARIEVLAERSDRWIFDYEQLAGAQVDMETEVTALGQEVCRWKLSRWTGSSEDLVGFYRDVGYPYGCAPHFFEALILRYRWLSFEVSDRLALLENPGGPGLELLANQIIRDEYIHEELKLNGFLQIGRPHEVNYDPIAIDLNPDDYGRLVQIDHEEILSRNRLGSVAEIAASLEEFIRSAPLST